MGSMPAAAGERDSDDALLREVLALRAQVAELQRAAARHEDVDGISLAEREELLREAERVAHLGTWTWDTGSRRASRGSAAGVSIRKTATSNGRTSSVASLG